MNIYTLWENLIEENLQDSMDSIWICAEYLVDIDLPENPSNHITSPSIYEARPLQNKCVLYSADNG